jgi:hypothetical protein
MSLIDFDSETIIKAVDRLMEQSSQTFPFEPVEQILNEDRTSEICMILGVSADLVKRFRDHGMSLDEADKIACKLGEHPSMIWDQWASIKPIPESLYDAVEEFIRSHKMCGKCKQWVVRSNFHKRTASKDGIARYCTPCMKIYEKERREKRGG